MISFGWDGQTTVKILAACMGLVGILAISVAAAFIVLKLGTMYVQKKFQLHKGL